MTPVERIGRPPVPAAERFWRYVEKGPDCWRWTGYVKDNGYGSFYGVGDKRTSAHRFSWELANGQSVPPGRVVMHSCDVRNCVNPAHLSLGTAQDNVRDMDAKGRRYPRGVIRAAAKLSVEQVSAVRRRYAAGGETTRSLATEYGVVQSCIAKIVANQSWKEVR